MPNDFVEASAMAAAAGASGGVTRIALSLHSGVRSGVLIAIEGFLGACLGFIAAGFALWIQPDLRTAGWSTMIVASFAGLASALGLRLLDTVMAFARHRLGVTAVPPADVYTPPANPAAPPRPPTAPPVSDMLTAALAMAAAAVTA